MSFGLTFDSVRLQVHVPVFFGLPVDYDRTAGVEGKKPANTSEARATDSTEGDGWV